MVSNRKGTLHGQSISLAVITIILVAYTATIQNVMAQFRTGHFMLCQSYLSDLPRNTREKLVEKFLGSGYLCNIIFKSAGFTSAPSIQISKVSTNPSGDTIYYHWYHVGTYRILMLGFTDV